MIEDKVANYDENDGQEENVEFKGDAIAWSELYTRHASCCDYSLCCTGVILSVAFGSSMPAMFLFFGEMIDGLGGGANSASLIDNVKRNYLVAVKSHGAPALNFSSPSAMMSMFSYFKSNPEYNPPDMSNLKT